MGPIEVVVNGGVVESFATERLRARRMAISDIKHLIVMHQNPAVMTFVGGVRDAATTSAWLERNVAHWDDHGFGQWMFFAADAFVGRGGLRMIDRCVGEELVEVGYVLDRPHWGRGFATEIAAAACAIAADVQAVTELGGITLRGNDASTRVLEKCVFVFERWVDHEYGPHRFLRRRFP